MPSNGPEGVNSCSLLDFSAKEPFQRQSYVCIVMIQRYDRTEISKSH